MPFCTKLPYKVANIDIACILLFNIDIHICEIDPCYINEKADCGVGARSSILLDVAETTSPPGGHTRPDSFTSVASMQTF